MRIKNTGSDKYLNLAKDIVVFSVGTVLAKAVQFFLMPLYTTYMSTEAYSVAELTNNLSSLLFPIVTLCIYEAAFRFAVEPNFDDGILAAAVLKVMLVSGSIVFFCAVAIKCIFNYQYTFLLYFILYAYSTRMCLASYTRGKGQTTAFAMSGVVDALALSLFNILFLVRVDGGVEGYLVSIGLADCCAAIYLLISSKFYQSVNFEKIKSTKKYINILLHYSVPLIFYNVLYWITTISGRYILLWFTDSSTAGLFVSATKISSVINMIQQAVYSAFQLNASIAYSDKDKEIYYSKIINLFTSLYCTFGGAVICMTNFIAALTLKNDFYSARIYLPVIMLTALFNCISSLIGAMYATYKKTERVIRVGIVGASINIVAGVILTPIWGIWGVCIASAVSYFFQVIYKVYEVSNFCKINYEKKKLVFNFVVIGLEVIIMSLNQQYSTLVAILLIFMLVVYNSKSIILLVNHLLHKKT